MKKILIIFFLFLSIFVIFYFEYNILNDHFKTENKKETKVLNPNNSIKQLNSYVKIKVNTKEVSKEIKDYINSYIISEIIEINVEDELTRKLYNEIDKMDLKLKEFIINFKEKEKLKNKIDVVRNITSSLNNNILEIKVDMNITTPYTEPIYLDYKVSIDIQKNVIIDEVNKMLLQQHQIEKFSNYIFENMKKYFKDNILILNNKKITINDYISNKDVLINNLIVNINNMNYYIDNNIICTQYTDLDILSYMNIFISKKNSSLIKLNIYKFE